MTERLTVAFDKVIEEPLTLNVTVTATSKDPLKYFEEPMIQLTYKVTLEPCFCETFDWPDLAQITVNQNKTSQILSFE